MFVLSQDRLTMDIEASTLQLMLQLLETDPELQNPEKEFDLILKDPALCAMQDKHREKVSQLCEEMQQKGHAKHLKLDNLNVSPSLYLAVCVCFLKYRVIILMYFNGKMYAVKIDFYY